MEYYRQRSPSQAKSIPGGPGSMTFWWKGGQRKLGVMSFGGQRTGVNATSLLTRLCRIGPQFLRGDKRLLSRTVAGDFVVRDEASPEAILVGVEEILSDAWKTPVSLKFTETEEDVYVARGVYKLSDVAKERRVMIIEKASQGGSRSIEEAVAIRHLAMRPKFGHFLESSVAEAVGFPVINEVTDPPDVRVFYNFYMDVDYISQFELGPQTFMVPPGPILESISKQTGLTFTKEKRVVKTLTLQRANEE